MFKVLAYYLKSIMSAAKKILWHFKQQYPYELKNISLCAKTGKHSVQIKITGKGQYLNYSADEVAADNDFLSGLSAADIRTIVYLATSEKYEAIIDDEKIKKSFEILRSKNINGKKTVAFRNKFTGEFFIKILKEFNDINIIEKLDSHDAYSLGYLAGQEQTSSVKMKLIDNSNNDKNG